MQIFFLCLTGDRKNLNGLGTCMHIVQYLHIKLDCINTIVCNWICWECHWLYWPNFCSYWPRPFELQQSFGSSSPLFTDQIHYTIHNYIVICFIQFYTLYTLFLPLQFLYLQYLCEDWHLSHILITTGISSTFIRNNVFVWVLTIVEPHVFFRSDDG